LLDSESLRPHPAQDPTQRRVRAVSRLVFALRDRHQPHAPLELGQRRQAGGAADAVGPQVEDPQLRQPLEGLWDRREPVVVQVELLQVDERAEVRHSRELVGTEVERRDVPEGREVRRLEAVHKVAAEVEPLPPERRQAVGGRGGVSRGGCAVPRRSTSGSLTCTRSCWSFTALAAAVVSAPLLPGRGTAAAAASAAASKAVSRRPLRLRSSGPPRAPPPSAAAAATASMGAVRRRGAPTSVMRDA